MAHRPEPLPPAFTAPMAAMSVPTPPTLFLQFLHRALRDQLVHSLEHPQSAKSQKALEELLPFLLQDQGPVELRLADSGFTFQGRPVLGALGPTTALAQEFRLRAMGGLSFQARMDPEELRTLLFLLQLSPQRLGELGGPAKFLPEDGSLRVLVPAAAAPPPAPPPARPAANFAEELDWEEVFAPVAPRPAKAPPHPPSATTLDRDLRTLFQKALLPALPPGLPGPAAPWGLDPEGILQRFGFSIPDFRGLAGAGAKLSLDALGPATLRAALRKVLAGLGPGHQGNVLLGLASLPPGEAALRRELDHLAPEWLGQAVAQVWHRHQPTLTELADLALALLQPVRDRDLALKALDSRLKAQGWPAPDLEKLRDILLWEFQGTDTRLQVSLETRGVHQLDPHQVKTLGRSLYRSGRLDDLHALVAQVEAELLSPRGDRRCHGAEILADLAAGVPGAGLPLDYERRLLSAARDGLLSGLEPQVVQWCAEAMETLVCHWIQLGQNRDAHAAMRFLRDLALNPKSLSPWKLKAVRELFARLVTAARAALGLARPDSRPAPAAVFSIYQSPRS